MISCFPMDMSSSRAVGSLRLKGELKRFLLPYFALGFDQHVANGPRDVCVALDELQSLEHICKFGRPLYVFPGFVWK
jgi:hypothetical protein